MRLPPGHPGRYYVDDLPEGNPERRPHPGSIDFLDLPPPIAGMVIKGLMLIGLVAAGCACRQPLQSGDRLTFLWEAAIVSVLMLLYSPLTWGQHCVAALPAFYLLIRGSTAEVIRGKWLTAFLWGFTALLVGTNRVLIGKDLSILVESYHPVTFALVGLVAVLFVVKAKTEAACGLALVACNRDQPPTPACSKRQAA
jgi:hypothetical protein